MVATTHELEALSYRNAVNRWEGIRRQETARIDALSSERTQPHGIDDQTARAERASSQGMTSALDDLIQRDRRLAIYANANAIAYRKAARHPWLGPPRLGPID
jgi:hypothetical protein